MKGTDKLQFSGFPSGNVRMTPLANVVFSELLPRIDSLAEAKVTLHCLWLLSQKRDRVRCVRRSELLRDGTLLGGLAACAASAQEPLEQALDLAVERGTLLRLHVELEGVVDDLYFANSARSRDTIAKLRSAEIDVGQVVLDESRSVVPERPGIFELYEQNFGPITPLLAEDLVEAEALYPPEWIEDAMREALRYNRRYWSYVRGILQRWAFEGRQDYEESRGGARRAGQTKDDDKRRWSRRG